MKQCLMLMFLVKQYNLKHHCYYFNMTQNAEIEKKNSSL
jgi:hypothetical protein